MWVGVSLYLCRSLSVSSMVRDKGSWRLGSLGDDAVVLGVVFSLGCCWVW